MTQTDEVLQQRVPPIYKQTQFSYDVFILRNTIMALERTFQNIL
jgi:hypothetical protein